MSTSFLPIKDNLHHAYVFFGHIDACIHSFKAWQEKEGITDVHIFEYETLGIDNVREFNTHATARRNAPTFLIITCDGIGLEAQHALLKTFEEPSPHTHILLIIPGYVSLLPTLLSRIHTIQSSDPSYTQDIYPVSDFLSDTPAVRLDTLKKLFSTKSKRNVSRRDVYALCAEIESLTKKHTELRHQLSNVYFVMKYIHINGSSPKMLLEYLSLILPSRTLPK